MHVYEIEVYKFMFTYTHRSITFVTLSFGLYEHFSLSAVTILIAKCHLHVSDTPNSPVSDTVENDGCILLLHGSFAYNRSQ